jgi:hypothetical protein
LKWPEVFFFGRTLLVLCFGRRREPQPPLPHTLTHKPTPLYIPLTPFIHLPGFDTQSKSQAELVSKNCTSPKKKCFENRNEICKYVPHNYVDNYSGKGNVFFSKV